MWIINMANIKERRQKNVKFGLSKDDNFEVESSFHEEGSTFNSARDYWQTMCRSGSSPERRCDDSMIGLLLTSYS